MHKRILKGPKDGEGALPSRTAHQPRDSEEQDAVRALSLQTYKIDELICTTKATQRPVLTVLDTGAGLNLSRSSMLPPEALAAMDTERRVAQLYSAMNPRLESLGVLTLSVSVGGQTSRQPFIVVRRLGTDAILGAHFIDEQIDDTKRSETNMSSRGWDGVPIVRKTCRNSTEAETTESKLVGPRRRAAQDQLRVAQRVTLEPQTDTVIPVNCPLSGLRMLEPDGALYDKKRVSLAHGVVSIRSDVPFNVKISNFGEVPVIVQKVEILGRAIESPIPSRILAIDLDTHVEGPAPRPASESTTKASLEDADLSHLNAVERTRVRSMLAPFASMWDGQLGLSKTTEHTIDLVPGARPIFTHPYRAGPERQGHSRTYLKLAQ